MCYENEVKDVEVYFDNFKKEYQWVVSESVLFGQFGGDYDFKKRFFS